jgi:hypothetical protein
MSFRNIVNNKSRQISNKIYARAFGLVDECVEKEEGQEHVGDEPDDRHYRVEAQPCGVLEWVTDRVPDDGRLMRLTVLPAEVARALSPFSSKA